MKKYTESDKKKIAARFDKQLENSYKRWKDLNEYEETNSNFENTVKWKRLVDLEHNATKRAQSILLSVPLEIAQEIFDKYSENSSDLCCSFEDFFHDLENFENKFVNTK
jgi:hypothetical protein